MPLNQSSFSHSREMVLEFSELERSVIYIRSVVSGTMHVVIKKLAICEMSYIIPHNMLIIRPHTSSVSVAI